MYKWGGVSRKKSSNAFLVNCGDLNNERFNINPICFSHLVILSSSKHDDNRLAKIKQTRYYWKYHETIYFSSEIKTVFSVL